MNLLAFETSTAVGSVALFKNNVLFDVRISENQKKHTEFLTQATQDLLSKADLEISEVTNLAVSIGPGSFTGIRVSVSAVRTYAQLLSSSVYIENSLQILAAQAPQPCICILNAYKNMVYIAAFDPTGYLAKPTAIPVTQIEAFLRQLKISKPILFLGDGFIFYEKILWQILGQQILRDENLSDFPSAVFLGQLALKNTRWTNEWKSIIPLYIRASEAEENLTKK